MISTSRHFIYLHPPKTGGNSISAALLPLSDDKMIVQGHQDGIDRFEIAGELTPRKHARLADYVANGVDIAAYRIVISARHPFDRAVSYYFSPHRWARQMSSGEWSIDTPQWDETIFMSLLPEMGKMLDFLRVDGRIVPPFDIIHTETIEADFKRVAAKLNLEMTTPFVHRNKSAASEDIYHAVRQSKILQNVVQDYFVEDMQFFGY